MAVDFDQLGRCPQCQQPLTHQETFFRIEFSDERPIVEKLGLRLFTRE